MGIIVARVTHVDIHKKYLNKKLRLKDKEIFTSSTLKLKSCYGIDRIKCNYLQLFFILAVSPWLLLHNIAFSLLELGCELLQNVPRES